MLPTPVICWVNPKGAKEVKADVDTRANGHKLAMNKPSLENTTVLEKPGSALAPSWFRDGRPSSRKGLPVPANLRVGDQVRPFQPRDAADSGSDTRTPRAAGRLG